MLKSGFWFDGTCFFMLIDFWGEMELGDVTCRCGARGSGLPPGVCFLGAVEPHLLLTVRAYLPAG